MEVNDTLWRPLKEAAERRLTRQKYPLSSFSAVIISVILLENVLNYQTLSKYTCTLFEAQASTPNALAN